MKELQQNEFLKADLHEIEDLGKLSDAFDLSLIFENLDQVPFEIFASEKKLGALGLNSIYGSALDQLNRNQSVGIPFFSFNGIAGFLNAQNWEIGVSVEKHKKPIEKSLSSSGLEPTMVLDRAGLVSPRVLAMIVNEAYYTVMEGTSAKEDIDIAMKLGTNYPFGPFEFSEKAGVGVILSILDHLHSEFKDERYKAARLLREEALKGSLEL